MSERFTVLLDAENAEFVETEADENDRSKAWIVNEAIRAARGEASIYDVNTGEVSTRGSTSAIESRLDDLEQRLSELESRDGDPEPTAREHDARDVTQRADGDGGDTPDVQTGSRDGRLSDGALSGSESTADLDELLSGVYDDMEHQPARREAGRAALQWLREQDGHHSGQDFKDALYDEWQVSGENEDTWWRKNARPALQAAADLGLVEYRTGHHDYIF